MANMDDFVVKITGSSDKLNAIEDIVKDAAYEGGGDMVSLLEEHGVGIEGLEIDADCHHVSLLTYLFGLGQYAKELERKASRNFISGCNFEDGVLSVYVYGPDGAEDFFKRLVELSPDVESYSVVAEDEDEEDFEDED